MKIVTLIIPCYNEEGNVGPFYRAALDTFAELRYGLELIFVDDGSSDGTYKAINRLVPEKDVRIECVSFSRNFGKEAAIYAGLQRSGGDYTVIIDADMQQDPHLIPAMLEVMESDPECDSVVYYQEKRRESKAISLCKHAFYRMINHVSDIEFRANASDFRLIDRKVVEAILAMPEVDRFSKGIFEWVGFNKTYLPYTPDRRLSGSSKWDLFSLVRYAFSGITSFSTRPMYIARSDREIIRKNVVKLKTGKEQRTDDEFAYRVL
jgi:glucosyltransferase